MYKVKKCVAGTILCFGVSPSLDTRTSMASMLPRGSLVGASEADIHAGSRLSQCRSHVTLVRCMIQRCPTRHFPLIGSDVGRSMANVVH